MVQVAHPLTLVQGISCLEEEEVVEELTGLWLRLKNFHRVPYKLEQPTSASGICRISHTMLHGIQESYSRSCAEVRSEPVSLHA